MKQRALLIGLGVLALGFGFVHIAEAAPLLPKVTGGGIALNERNEEGPSGTVSAGFAARATGPFVADAPGDVPNGYPARGQVQLIGRFDDPAFPDARVHGEVVCLWNHGDPQGTAHEGDSDSHADVWEIRIRITETTLTLPNTDDDVYLSIYVQDGGRRGTDFVGESLNSPFDADCGEGEWDLEPLVRGNARVHS